MSSPERDPPPKIGPEDRLPPEALGQLARALLSEMARNDPALAERMPRLGIPPGGEDHAGSARGGASATDARRPDPALLATGGTETLCRNRPP